MSLKALFYAYVLGGLTFLPLVILAAIFYTIYTSVPVGDPDPSKFKKRDLQEQSQDATEPDAADPNTPPSPPATAATDAAVNDLPRTRRGWLTVRRTFEESPADTTYVDFVRGLIDARSKDPKRSRPKDTWYVALKGTVLYLYEDESMTDCEAAIELSGHAVVIYPEGLLDGELFAKRNAICLKPKGAAGAGADAEDGVPAATKEMPSVTREMQFGAGEEEADALAEEKGGTGIGAARRRERERERLAELERKRDDARIEALNPATPWFIFVRSAVEMEDWYLALVHASDQPALRPTLEPLRPVFRPEDMAHLVSTLDEQPDVIPMRWLNALLGRVFFSYYRTHTLEAYIIGRLMKKISKVKRPAFLTDINVRDVSVGNKAPTLSKPMLKELTKEGDASLEVHLAYKGEVRVTVEATATINLGARFKTYVVKLVLALVLREIEGNLLIKVKRPPSSRIWYAFTQMPRVVLDVEPVVSDRQITWSMILSTIESKVKEVIYESVVMPNMDDISFFDSAQYSHRGGIWADASRHERAPTLDGEETTADMPSVPTKVDTGEPDLPDIPRSHSAEELEKTTSSSPPEGTPMARATTVDVAQTTGTSSNVKRRTWFSNGQEALNTPSTAPPDTSGPEEPVSRGRPLVPDVAGRSSSQPTFSAQSEDDAPEAQYLSAERSTRRSPSQHSRSASSRAASVSSSHAGDVSDDSPESQSTSYRSKSPAPPGSSPRQPPTSPNSFFQTLKSRAGDKQALSNTAKETMRKWGVSWGNFRRESISNGSGNGQSGDELPDAGHGDQRSDSRAPTVRPSYAEVRAAVEERRERDRAPLGEGSSRSNQPTSEPIPVPQDDKGKERVEGAPSSQAPHVSPNSNGLTKSDPATTETNALPRSVSPVPLERTESQVSNASQHVKPAAPSIAPEEPERPAAPIYTQPLPPKTMTIPGIHAKHRGEVMSMGYAPPPPAVPQEPKKAPLQSVIRLWKTSAANSTSDRNESALVSQTGFTGRDQDSTPTADGGQGEPSTNVQMPPQPARVPPPLPPRANSTQVLLTKPEIARPTDAAESPPLSLASAALQSIVSQDRVRRASLTPPASTPSSPGRAEDAVEQSNPLDRNGKALSESPASLTPTPSSPPSPPPAGAAIGRGPPPALPPRRLRTAS